MKFTDLAYASAWQEFRENGFLRIEKILDPIKVSNLREEAYNVFREVKRIESRAYRNSDRSGYSPAGIEGVAGKRVDFGRQFWDLHLSRESDGKVCGHSKDLVRHMRHLTLELSVIMYGVFYFMERGLGTQASGLHQVMLNGAHGLRATHYPLIAKPEDDVLFPEHRDFSLVTVLIGGAEPGLQLMHRNEWRDLENPLGDIVVMAGGMIRYWSGGPKESGRISGLRHRVRHLPAERLSLSFFTEPEHSTVLPHGDGLTAGEYISRFVASTRTI